MKSEDVVRLTREAQTSALKVKATFLLAPPPSALIPAVWLDASTRPDVSDLMRVHRSEGEGDIQTFWLYTASDFYLHCDLTRPVATTFWVQFPLPDQKSYLSLIAQLGVFSIFTSSPPVWLLSPDGSGKPTAIDMQMALVEGFSVSTRQDELFVMLARWPALWGKG